MKRKAIMVYVGSAALVLGTAAIGSAQQAGGSCSQDIARARAQIWRAEAALDIAAPMKTASRTGKALASSPMPQQGEVSGAGRSTMPPQGEVSGAGRSTMPPQGEVSGAGRALAAAPGFTPSIVRASNTTNAQFRVLSSAQDRQTFVESLNPQERKLLYQSLSTRDRKRLTASLSPQEVKDASQNVSAEDSRAWADKIATNRTALSKKVQRARVLARAAHALCMKGDAAGASAKANEAIELLK